MPSKTDLLRGSLRLALAACTSATPAALAQVSGEGAFLGEQEPRAQIMILGVFHFAYPDLDVEKTEHRIDVLEPGRQAEIAEVLDRIAEYRPTRIAVEFTPDRQTRLDSLYAEYRMGRWELPRNEVYQLGFRLADRLGHSQVYAVDTERHPFFVDLAVNELAPRREELFATDRESQERFSAARRQEDSLSASRGETLREILLRSNSPDRLRRDHMIYSVGFFKFDGDEGGYLGADFVSGWYNRNLRIFRNLQRITRSPEERILLIIGSGHSPILRFVTQHSPEYDLVEVAEYLEGP